MSGRPYSRLALVLSTIAAVACQPPDPEPGGGSPPPKEKPAIHFVDVVAAVGLGAFHQVSGDADKMRLPASTGAGVALFDADVDGDLDVFLINGSRMGGFAPGEEPTNKLFLNQGQGEAFIDTTAEAGLASHGAWGQGLAVADVDGDARPDLYVTNYGRNALYLNREGPNGIVTFEQVAAKAGIDSERWSTGAAFIDYDRDGDLDLYVANFVRYDLVLDSRQGRDWITHTWKGQTVVAGPMGLPAAGDQLFRNDSNSSGEVRFTEVTEELGIGGVEPSNGFQPLLGDYDGDGWLDLFVANFADELNTLYRGDGAGFFHDDTIAAGLAGQKTMSNLAWGTFFFDADNDGASELFVANGHVYPQVDAVDGPESFAQANQLFKRVSGGRFQDVSAAGGPGFAVEKVSRGAALGDLDGDGDLDIVINNLDATPTVLRNDSRVAGSWIKVLLRGSGRNRFAIGARVRVEAGGRVYSRYRRSSDSYLSHHDPRLHFGLGAAQAVDRLVIDWPDGSSESFPGSKVDALVVVEQGTGVGLQP